MINTNYQHQQLNENAVYSGLTQQSNATIAVDDAALSARTTTVDAELHRLNHRFQELRWKLFGDDSKPAAPEAEKAPAMPVQRAVQSAQFELRAAHDQMTAILERL